MDLGLEVISIHIWANKRGTEPKKTQTRNMYEKHTSETGNNCSFYLMYIFFSVRIASSRGYFKGETLHCLFCVLVSPARTHTSMEITRELNQDGERWRQCRPTAHVGRPPSFYVRFWVWLSCRDAFFHRTKTFFHSYFVFFESFY